MAVGSRHEGGGERRLGRRRDRRPRRRRGAVGVRGRADRPGRAARRAAIAMQLRLVCNLLDGLVAIEGGPGTAPTGGCSTRCPDRLADALGLAATGYASRRSPPSWAGPRRCAAALTAYVARARRSARASAGLLGVARQATPDGAADRRVPARGPSGGRLEGRVFAVALGMIFGRLAAHVRASACARMQPASCGRAGVIAGRWLRRAGRQRRVGALDRRPREAPPRACLRRPRQTSTSSSIWSSLPPAGAGRPAGRRRRLGRGGGLRRRARRTRVPGRAASRAAGRARAPRTRRRLLPPLDRGDSLIVFPEGARGDGEQMAPSRAGLYHVCRGSARARVSVPVHLDDLTQVLPKGEAVPIPLMSRVTSGRRCGSADAKGEPGFLARARAAVVELGGEEPGPELARLLLIVVAPARRWAPRRASRCAGSSRPGRGGDRRRTSTSGCALVVMAGAFAVARSPAGRLGRAVRAGRRSWRCASSSRWSHSLARRSPHARGRFSSSRRLQYVLVGVRLVRALRDPDPRLRLLLIPDERW